MNITEIKERYDYDNPNGDFFYESINCAEARQRAKDFKWLIDESEQLKSEIDDIGSNRRNEALDEIATADAMDIFNNFEDWLRQSKTTIERCLDKEFAAGQSVQNKEMDELLDRAEKAEAKNKSFKDFINEIKISADRSYLREKAEKLLEEL